MLDKDVQMLVVSEKEYIKGFSFLWNQIFQQYNGNDKWIEILAQNKQNFKSAYTNTVCVLFIRTNSILL